MKITSLTIENFLAIGEAKISLADRGLVLIEGVNERDSAADSNGSGKSSIADALCWALFGVTARGVSGDDVINEEAGKGCKVEVEIDDGDFVYTIARHRKHKTGKNSVTVWVFEKGVRSPGKDLTLGTDKLTQAVVDKIIGSSYDVFKSSIYAGQEQLPDLPAMTDKQLKILVEEAAGVTILEEAYGEARQRYTVSKSELDLLERRAAEAQRLVENEKDRITFDITSAINDFEKDRKEKIEQLTAHARSKAAEAKRFAADIAKTNKVGVEAGIADCDAQIAAVSGQVLQDRVNDQTVAAANGTHSKAAHSVDYNARKLSEVEAEILKVDHEVGCPCTSCARPMTEQEILPRKAALERVRQTYIADQAKAVSAVDAAKNALASVTDERDRFRASMTDISAKSAERASLQKDLAGILLLEKGRDEAIRGAKEFVNGVEGWKNQTNPHTATLEAAQIKIGRLEAEVVGITALVNAKIQEVKVAELVAKVFSPAGVRAHILDDVTPFLNEQTAKYLASLTDGAISATWSTLVKNAKGELREKFSIEVVADKGGKTFAAISGGEKRKVRLAAALALQDLVARRATKPIDLFIGDEIDDALDDAGRERLMGVLEEKARERGSVFIISHSDLKDWISQVITVTKPVTGGSIIAEMAA